MPSLRKAYLSLLKVFYRSARSTIFQSESVYPSKDCIDLLSSKAKAFILQKIAEGLLQSVSKTRSVKFYFGLSMARHCLWKMCATPSACIKPGCLARWPLCHKVNFASSVARRPLCHKVNLPRWEARQRHFIMTCDIYGTGQTNSLALCFVFGKT